MASSKQFCLWLLAVVSAVVLTGVCGSNAIAQSDPVAVCKDPRGCEPVSNPPSGSTPNGPNIWQILSQNKENAAREKRLNEATAANKRGIAAWNRGDYETAVREFTTAHEKNPDSTTIAKNLEEAQKTLKEMQEYQAKSAVGEAKRQQIAGETAKRMNASMQTIVDSMTAAPATSGLEFGDPKKSDLKDAPSSLNYMNGPDEPCKPSSGGLSFGDPTTVDARCVPSGLPKSVQDSIEGSFAKSPPGVGERVRKGFQALMTKDRDAAKAWFQDALNRDPNNEGLKRMVDLIDYSSKSQSQPKLTQIPLGQDGSVSLLNDDEMLAIFPESQSPEKIQAPMDADIEFLFDHKPKDKPLYLRDAAFFLWNKAKQELQAPVLVVTFYNGRFRVDPVADDRSVILPDGPYVVGKDGKLYRSANHSDYFIWDEKFGNKFSEPNQVTKKP